MDEVDDLFGHVPKTFKRLAYADAPGSGPDDETCGSCGHCWRTTSSGGGPRNYYKCGLMSMSHSENTDIRRKSPACRHWKEDDR